MGSFREKSFLRIIIKNIPIILLLVSVLNEFDFNYLGLDYFSFDFPFILIFYWSLKRNESLGYGLIFVAGMINDVVVGLPIGISSLSYLSVCVFAAYLRNITLRPSLVKDWIFFLFTIFFIKSLIHLILVLFFSIELDYSILMINLFFTFLMYYFLSHLFRLYLKLAFGNLND
ncbi:rod shape-determining protein MreD [Pelagibacteraceae bacterium]|jgi:rod shape-determining protein MreD|nr:rod shape-determining protein MreD [Candidatus Pelagibacter sp.]MDC1485359.1 rod shape-determining protein MreD [Pelagibacteraceae bacterium]|tara:strand:+ start:440 stop:958 length:519 start_codon:yes stop_codon:yes gene_type:complete